MNFMSVEAPQWRSRWVAPSDHGHPKPRDSSNSISHRNLRPARAAIAMSHGGFELYRAARDGRKEEVSKWLSKGVKWNAHRDLVS